METEKKPRIRASHWCMTINNPIDMDDLQLKLFQDQCDYMVIGKEHWEPKEGEQRHYQIYLKTKNPMSFVAMKKLFARAHIEPKVRAATVAQAADYCKKEGNFEEFGEIPKEQTEVSREKIADNWAKTKAAAQENKLDEIEPEHYIKHYTTLKKIRDDVRNAQLPAHLPHTKIAPNFWYYGPTGTGKSHRARRANADDVEEEDFYYKMNNQWWENYENQDNILIEDVGQSHLWMGDHLKIWADRYAFRARVLFSSIVLRPKKIVVTSNYHPKDLWPDPAVHLPIMRRFQIVHLEHPWDAKLGIVEIDVPTGETEEMEVMGTCHVDGSGACHPKKILVSVVQRQNSLGAVVYDDAIDMEEVEAYESFRSHCLNADVTPLPFEEWREIPDLTKID